MTNRNNMKRKKTKKNTGKIIALSIFAILSIAIISGSIYIGSLLGKINKININDQDIAVNEKVDTKGIRNIALFGIDAENGKNGRSDAIMILTIDEKRNKVKLSSIMRDSYVNIDGHGMDKINHAYAFGGPSLAIKTLNKNFDLNIREFVSVNFTSLPKIIDMLGGIEVNIIPEEIKHIPGINKSGTQTLNGKQALAYSRIRYATGGDTKRTERQREVLGKMFSKLTQMPISKYPKVANEILPLTDTNLSSGQIISLGSDVAKMGTSLEQQRFPMDGQASGKKINGVYYLTFNKGEVSKSIYDYIFKDIAK